MENFSLLYEFVQGLACRRKKGQMHYFLTSVALSKQIPNHNRKIHALCFTYFGKEFINPKSQICCSVLDVRIKKNVKVKVRIREKKEHDFVFIGLVLLVNLTKEFHNMLSASALLDSVALMIAGSSISPTDFIVRKTDSCC